jgi:hypothetical protein
MSSYHYLREDVVKIPCARVTGLNPRVSITIFDVNNIPRQAKEGMYIYDCETVKATLIQSEHDLEKCYTVQCKVNGIWQDKISIMIAAPVIRWRRDLFYIEGDDNTAMIGHILRSQC